MNYSKQEKIDMLLDAQEKLFEVIETIEEVFPEDGNVKAYMIDHLRIKASSDHGFLSSDLNINELIERIQNDS